VSLGRNGAACARASKIRVSNVSIVVLYIALMNLILGWAMGYTHGVMTAIEHDEPQWVRTCDVIDWPSSGEAQQGYIRCTAETK